MTAPMSEQPKAALVTGGAVRVGQAIAMVLAQAGYDIALHYNTHFKEAEETQALVEAIGQACTLHQADLKTCDHDALVRQAHDAHNGLSVLINNAAIFSRAEFLETTPELFDDHMALNFRAPFFCSQAFAKYCKKGNIINITDAYVSKYSTAYTAYMLSKKAFGEATKMMAKSLAPDIRVNAIAPGITELSDDVAELRDAKTKSLPLKRVANLADITKSLIHLIDHDAITGQTIYLDGGELLL